MAFNNINPIAIDLFCGAGGLSLGLEQSNITVPLGVEINAIAAQTYTNNLNGNVLQDDIRNITGHEILERLNLQVGELFLLAGCPPCQTFSSLQKDDVTNDARNNLIFEYTRLIRETRPLFILMENVPGLANGRVKQIFAQALAELEPSYHVLYDVLNCADYGVPQTRKRLVLHGIRNDVYQLLIQNQPNFKISLPSKTHTNDPQQNPNLLPWVTAGQALQNNALPAINAGQPAPVGYPNHETNGLAEINIQRIQYIRTHGGSRNCLPPHLQLPCHQRNNVGYSGVYGIIDVTKPAPTMTGGCICYSKDIQQKIELYPCEKPHVSNLFQIPLCFMVTKDKQHFKLVMPYHHVWQMLVEIILLICSTTYIHYNAPGYYPRCVIFILPF